MGSLSSWNGDERVRRYTVVTGSLLIQQGTSVVNEATMPKASTKKAKKSPSDEVDAQLKRYRAMRDFAVTAEPSGGSAAPAPEGGLPFVIQKHAATRLHYDFRLGWRGVLKSWACAKGPSYNTKDRRLAVQVEDHPMEYGGFEGTIPKGQYGGGTVMLWDQGTWEPLPDHDFDEGLEKGAVKFTLHGQKLEGRWTLVRMGGHAAQEGKPNWLLIKEHDGNERPETAAPITDEAPDSVVTGRSLDAIAEAEDHVWQSRPAEHTPAPANHSRIQQRLKDAHLHGTRRAAGKTGPTPAVPTTKVAAKSTSTTESWLASAPEEAMPAFLPPQLASASTSVPQGSGWLHELKLDGYRVQAHLRTDAKGKRTATLFTRSGLDWTHRMKGVARAVEKLEVEQAVLDGEVVVLDEQGKSSFAKLQAAFEKGEAATFTYFTFDLLHLNGRNLRGLSLRTRKSALEPLIAAAEDPLLQFSQHLQLDANQVFAHACELGAEGILSKQSEARYTAGRSDSWLKLKCTHRQEFVIGGFTLPKDKGTGLGSLLVGYYEDGQLVHCGRCGTGFSQATARAVRKQLEPLRAEKPPFDANLGREGKKDAIWVRPALVCEVEFATWTADGSLRHASFQGMRLDKPAQEVRKEAAEPAPSAEKPAEKPAESEAPAKPKKKTAKPETSAAIPKSAAKLTHPDKVLDAPTGTTKQQLADYYEAVAAVMLPHLAARPISIVRCPNGSEQKCFFQKHANTGLPNTVGAIPIPDKDDPKKVEEYIALDTAEALTAMAQLGVLELHPWGSTAVELEKPDRLIFDLDPDESLAWNTVVDAAEATRDFLKELRLESFVKTTGGKGLHIVVAIEPAAEWPEIRLFCRGVAAAMESSDPKLYLIKMTKAARTGRIFIDWMRNERGATAVAPWSPRARAGMRCAVPLAWDELRDGMPKFAVADFAEWQARAKPANNPWATMKPQPLRPEVLAAVLEHTGAEKAGKPRRWNR